jgi:hypothetical protein
MQIANAANPALTLPAQTPAQASSKGPGAPAPVAAPPPPGAAATTGTFYPQQAFSSGFASPFNVFGSPFAGGGYGNFGFGGPAAGLPGAAAPGASGHTVVNSTNALASSEAQGAGALGAAPGATQGGVVAGSFGYAQPAFLVPAILPVGLPVFIAVGVFAFASPIAAPQPTPVASPGPAPTPTPAVPPAADKAPPAADAPALDAPVSGEPPVIDVPPVTTPATKDDTPAPVVSLSNPEFARYAERFETQSLTSELVLSLRTAEGDEISLNFKQLDVLQTETFSGQQLSGERVRRDDESESSERFVTIEVDGDLSAEEQAAIDRVIAGVTDVANQFFSGAYDEARTQLAALDFDASTLSELSLNLTTTRQAEIARSYRGDADPLDQLRNRGGEIVQALEFLATEQRQLIDSAKDVFDDASAARLVRTLVPSLLADAVSDLRDEIAESGTAALADAAEDAQAEPAAAAATATAVNAGVPEDAAAALDGSVRGVA